MAQPEDVAASLMFVDRDLQNPRVGDRWRDGMAWRALLSKRFDDADGQSILEPRRRHCACPTVQVVESVGSDRVGRFGFRGVLKSIAQVDLALGSAQAIVRVEYFDAVLLREVEVQVCQEAQTRLRFTANEVEFVAPHEPQQRLIGQQIGTDSVSGQEDDIVQIGCHPVVVDGNSKVKSHVELMLDGLVFFSGVDAAGVLWHIPR